MRPAISLVLLAWMLCACEPSTKGVNLNIPGQRLYAGVRVLNLLTDAPALDTYVSVVNDLPVAFAQVTSPGVTPFHSTPVGKSSAYVSSGEATVASSASHTTAPGDRFTVIESGATASGALPAATVQWVAETAQAVAAGQAAARFVLGVPSLTGAVVTLGTATLSSGATLGALSAWLPVDPSATTLTLTPSAGTPMKFPLPPLVAGQLHTYAVATGPAATPVVLVDITEAAAGDGTASPPIAPESP